MILRMPRLPLFIHRFTLCGLNLERFMNLLGKQGIPLLAAARRDTRTLDCACYSADLPAIRQLAQEKGWRLLDPRPAQLSAAAAWLRRRPGVPAGLALALALILTLSQFVWQVEIHQAGAYQADIAAYLTELGYRPGRLKRTVDAASLERALTRRYPSLAWLHVYVHASTLVVDVSQGVPMPDLPTAGEGDVTALRDGIISMVNVYAGTPLVKVGDAVRAGQVLIRGRERAADGQTVPIKARGVVLARCWRSETVQLPLTEIQSGETGRQTVRFQLCTPWLRYPDAVDTAPYLASNAYITRTPVGGCFFPLWLETVLYKEVWMEYTPRDLEEVKAEAAQAALKQLKTSLRGDEIIDKWVDYCMIEGDQLAATATAEWLMDIGGSQSP